MSTKRPETWIRGLTLWEGPLDDVEGAFDTIGGGGGVQAHSLFRSLTDPDRHATYSVEETCPTRATIGGDRHTLAVVREFRWVPLRASALALTVFRARPGRTPTVIAALAHFAERAVSRWQPAYLLVARSLDDPSIAVLITALNEPAALASASPSAFSLDALLAEVAPLLETNPEIYAHRPTLPASPYRGDRSDFSPLLAPRAV